MPYPRTRADIDALDPPPSEAERHFLACCTAGETCELGDGSRPEEWSEARSIRAAILRYAILGGCPDSPTAERGVFLVGAWIPDALDLAFCTTARPVGLVLCHFTEPVSALQTRLPALVLNGSRLPGLDAQGAQIDGHVFLRAKGETRFEATGAVSLAGARIGGQLSCEGARLAAAGGMALNAQGAQIDGGVFLRAVGETRFEATGEVSFSGARIGGQLACDGARLAAEGGDALNATGAQIDGGVFLRAMGETRFEATGAVSLAGAHIGGQFACWGARLSAARESGIALTLQRAQVTEGFYWCGVEAGAGRFALNGAEVGDLADDLDCWPETGLDLDGFRYERIVVETGAGPRKAWLAKGTVHDGAFYPAAYGQLAKVLRAMGNVREAREILFERERLQRMKTRADSRLYRPALWIWHSIERLVAGYGFKPFRSLGAFFVLWAVCWGLAFMAWEAGEMAPVAGPLLSQEEWQAAFRLENPGKVWSATPVGTSWQKFSAAAYAFDVVVPLVDIGQVSAWGPMVDDATPKRWGYALWRGQWVLGVFGWIVALVATAGLSGVLSSQRD